MRVLVACEESQAVCKEFRRLGHEAYSCDIQPCSGGHPEWHIQDDVMDVLKHDIGQNPRWDMVIAFPPCTHLAVSGARHFAKKKLDGRQNFGIKFFEFFTRLNTRRVAIENPVGIMSTIYRKPDQIIRPFMFGDNSTKGTCLWLKNMPILKQTITITPTRHTTKSGRSYDEWWFKSSLIQNLEERARFRSKTFPGIARAMAEQWGAVDLLDNPQQELFANH